MQAMDCEDSNKKGKEGTCSKVPCCSTPCARCVTCVCCCPLILIALLALAIVFVGVGTKGEDPPYRDGPKATYAMTFTTNDTAGFIATLTPAVLGELGTALVNGTADSEVTYVGTNITSKNLEALELHFEVVFGGDIPTLAEQQAAIAEYTQSPVAVARWSSLVSGPGSVTIISFQYFVACGSDGLKNVDSFQKPFCHGMIAAVLSNRKQSITDQIDSVVDDEYTADAIGLDDDLRAWFTLRYESSLGSSFRFFGNPHLASCDVYRMFKTELTAIQEEIEQYSGDCTISIDNLVCKIQSGHSFISNHPKECETTDSDGEVTCATECPCDHQWGPSLFDDSPCSFLG